MDRRADGIWMLPVKPHRVINDQAGNEQREEERQPDQEEIQRIDATGHRRRLIGK